MDLRYQKGNQEIFELSENDNSISKIMGAVGVVLKGNLQV